MSWHFSRALEAAFLEENCSAGKQFALWSSIPSAADDSCSAKMKDTFHHSPFGTMYAPSTESRGAELLTWFLEGFPARTSALAAKAMDSTASAAGCGEKWHGSFAKFNQNTSSWKTHQLSLAGDLDEFSETWPQWGLMRDGECWELTTPELRTCGTDYGLWPTPCASDSADRKASPNPHLTKNGTLKHIGKSGVLSQIRLSQAVKHFAAPEHTDGPMNPAFPEWLMGWPIGWTGCEPLATDRLQEWQQQHGKF